MHTNLRRPAALAVLLAAAALWAVPAQAGKPEWAGGPHAGTAGHGDPERHSVQANDDKRGGKRTAAGPQGVTVGGYFGERQRTAARSYYEDEGRHSRGKGCPPGLAKKHNGCMPPGQARKWAVGRELPRDVTYYPVPQAVVVTLGVPPAGYRYVRVASDILLIAVGSRMVMDGIQDLVR